MDRGILVDRLKFDPINQSNFNRLPYCNYTHDQPAWHILAMEGLLDEDLDLSEMLGIEEDTEEPAAASKPYDHRRKKVVCKHWLRGLCKKTDEDCDYLHRLDHGRMPECWCRLAPTSILDGWSHPSVNPLVVLTLSAARRFFAHYGDCTNRECIFRHVRPEDKTLECPWYNRGFCKHGARCHHRHTRKKPCVRYLGGFCPDGPNCAFGHPKFEVPMMPRPPGSAPAIGGVGSGAAGGGETGGVKRDLSTITCFKCWQKGHYANACPNARVMQPEGGGVGGGMGGGGMGGGGMGGLLGGGGMHSGGVGGGMGGGVGGGMGAGSVG